MKIFLFNLSSCLSVIFLFFGLVVFFWRIDDEPFTLYTFEEDENGEWKAIPVESEKDWLSGIDDDLRIRSSSTFFILCLSLALISIFLIIIF